MTVISVLRFSYLTGKAPLAIFENGWASHFLLLLHETGIFSILLYDSSKPDLFLATFLDLTALSAY